MSVTWHFIDQAAMADFFDKKALHLRQTIDTTSNRELKGELRGEAYGYEQAAMFIRDAKFGELPKTETLTEILQDEKGKKI